MTEYDIKTEHREAIVKWYDKEPERIFIISGYAGCGKTTLARRIPEILKLSDVAFLAPTGKAATVIGRHGRTIHSFLYDARVDPDTKEVIFRKKNKEEFESELLIVDEISMVSDELLGDLIWTEIPIIGLGDPAQLPPVNGKNTILEKPDIFLTEVFRNDGGILALATDIRQKNKYVWKYSNVYLKFSTIKEDLHNIKEDGIIICKFNKTRNEINRLYRTQIKKFTLLLNEGDKLIITRNNKGSGLMNGSIITVKQIKRILRDELLAIITFDNDDGYEQKIYISLWTLLGKEGSYPGKTKENVHEADYAYAITCHKAQGSEFERVYIVNEGQTYGDHRAWFYTAVTRARKEVYIYG